MLSNAPLPTKKRKINLTFREKQIEAHKNLIRMILMEIKCLISSNAHKQVMSCLWRCAEDAIGHVGCSPKAQIRLILIIAIYLKSYLVHQIKTQCHYFGIGLDAQTTKDHHKFLSVWI